MPDSENSASAVVRDTTIYLPLEGMLDVEKECERLSNEREKVTADIKSREGKLSNASFVNKAPEPVVQRERDSLAESQAELEKIDTLLASLCG